MTDISTETTPSKKKRSLFLPIAAAVITIAIIGFVASRAGIDKALVKQQLDNFIAQVKERGRAQGRDIEITYGDLDVVGSFASKHVVIHQPVLVIKPMVDVKTPGATQNVEALRVTTPSMEIYPQAMDMSSLKITAPEPIDFASLIQPEQSLLKWTSTTPPALIVSQVKKGDVPYTETEYQSPNQMEFTYLREQQAAGTEDKAPTVVPVYEVMGVATAQGSTVKSSMANDGSGLGEVKTDFHDIVLTPKAAPEGMVKIAEVTGNWSNSLNDKKLNVVHAQAKAGPITSDNKDAPYLPILLTVDATYQGAMPKTAEAIANIQSPESIITIKDFSLTTKDSALKATADFTANATDILPVGKANVALTNVPFVLGELHKYGLISPQMDPAVGAVLAAISGTPAEQIKDLNIPIERARGGAFKIGNSTSDELFAVFLKAAMSRPGQPVVIVPGAVGQPMAPQLPSADKPKAAPIDVPDHGVRG